MERRKTKKAWSELSPVGFGCLPLLGVIVYNRILKAECWRLNAGIQYIEKKGESELIWFPGDKKSRQRH